MIQKNPQFAQTWPQRPNGIAYLIGRLDHVLNRRIRDAIAPWEVTAAQYTALSVLNSHGQLSNAQLAERSMVSPQSANEMVKLMQARGWITRESAASHGRIIHIRLTPQGEELLAECDAAVVRVEKALLAELDEDQYAPLHGRLRAMMRGLSHLSL
ncbi:MAG TPA: MarR family transcriptional regulator [Pusillimonas sp.]|uniref:MarR family winged helix-turn-helix transcriptional regulator n=1 Tax=Pusillimonas sp. TaxID=3040095 RepID=UPI002C7B738B|nr:MarR family transcriptional regulator [Pusillimonas sp.]HUH87072.1 MarR family transcriptional regulator [Pusillimonas sp.]